MKKHLYLVLIFLGITLFIIGVFIYNKTEPFEAIRTKTAQINELIHNSQGQVALTVEYPAELQPQETGVIKLIAVPDARVKKVLDKNLTIDSHLTSLRLATESERRQTELLNTDKTVISWQVNAKTTGLSKGRVSVGISDKRSDPTLYPLAAQHHFEFDIHIVENKSKAGIKDYLGHILMGIGLPILIAGFILAYREFDNHTKKERKQKR